MIERLRRELENELKTQVLESEYRKLKANYPSLAPFRTASDLIEFMKPSEDYDLKDDLLAILINEYKASSPLRIAGTLLLLTFLPILKNLFYTQRRNFYDDEELLCMLQCCFLEAAQDYPLDKRPKKIAANLKFLAIRLFLNDQSALCKESEFQKRLIDEAEKFGADEEQFSELYPGIAPAGIHDRESVEMTIRNFRSFVDGGIVNETDFKLVIKTRVFDKDLGEVADEMGITYASARQRRSRAERAMKMNFKIFF